MKRCALLVLMMMAVRCFGQEVEPPRFEVASLKAASRSAPRTFSGGGPGTSDPARFVYSRIELKYLISIAYYPLDVERISGPKWLDSEYAISAKIPLGTDRKQFRKMLAGLLAERFGLVFHMLTKQVPGYELTVNQGGVKGMKPSSNQSPGTNWQGVRDAQGGFRMTFQRSSMAVLADMLSLEFSRKDIPVVDKTAVSGDFDFTVEFPEAPQLQRVIREQEEGETPAAEEPEVTSLGSISPLLEKQLGLKLRAVRADLEYMVVDQVRRLPTEN